MASKRTEELLKYDSEHIIHSMSFGGQAIGITFEQAAGTKIIDSDGKEYIDCASQLVNVNLGHNRKDIIEVAKAQMDKLMFAATLRGASNVPSIEYARKLADFVPKGMDHFLFTMTGGDADDCAFKLVNLYFQARKERKYKIISLYGSYHGLLRGTGSATGVAKGTMAEKPAFGNHLHIPEYFCYRCPFHKEYPSCDIACAEYLDYVIENEGADTIACFIAEPIQGAGGFVSPPPEYFPRIREICDKHGVLFIADEVMTGFGRTGKMWGIDHWGIKPDILTMSKGIVAGYVPFGAVAVSEEISSTLKEQFLSIGSTESGNPICCAIASKVLDIYREERIPEKAAALGEHVRARLEKEFLPLPHVGAITGMGLMLGAHIVVDKKTRTPVAPEVGTLILNRGAEVGLLLRMTSSSYQFAPPLTMEKEEADEALDRIYPILAELKLD